MRRPAPGRPAGELAAALLLAGALAAGCSRPSAPGDAAAVLQAEARAAFSTRCSSCHGAQGAGDGPVSAGLQPPPRDLRDPAWQASVSDAHIERVVAGGGPAVGRSAAMPAHPDLASSPALLAALRAYVRQLAPAR